jgi:hypothetical protein
MTFCRSASTLRVLVGRARSRSPKAALYLPWQRQREGERGIPPIQGPARAARWSPKQFIRRERKLA